VPQGGELRDGARAARGTALAHRAAMLRALFVLSLALAAGCVTADTDALDEGASDLAGGDDGAALADPPGPIEYLAGGVWYRRVGCPSPDPSTCLDEGRVWVDLRIRNDAYDKRVGIVWIDEVRDDANGPWHVATGGYEGAFDATTEQWGIDVTTGVYGGNEPRPRIRFAAFVEMAGTTAWDNHGGADHVLP
jgi:hypothetical protein